MTNQITYRAALELASHEAIVRQAYKDSVGVWTWSVGITSASGHSVERYIGKPQTLEHCLSVFVWALERYAADVNDAFKGRTLSESQFAAALSFHYNTGAIKRASWVRSFLAGDTAAAKRQFMEWRRPPEIIKRREAERDLFFDGKWSNDGKITEYTAVSPSGSPRWSSAKRISIENELRAAFPSNKTEEKPPLVDVKEPVEASPIPIEEKPMNEQPLSREDLYRVIEAATAALRKLDKE